jgi:hypothetical protein
MRRSLLRIAIFILAFGLGVGVSACWQLYRWSLLPIEVSPEAVAVPNWAAPPRITMGGGIDACGPTANFHTRELSDGTRISQSCETFSSPLAAARELKIRLGNGSIAQRSAERDENGLLIGESILTTRPGGVMRLSIFGNSLCVTEAPSLTHLRLYETNPLNYSPIVPGNE